MLRVIYRRASHAGPSGPLCFARIKVYLYDKAPYSFLVGCNCWIIGLKSINDVLDIHKSILRTDRFHSQFSDGIYRIVQNIQIV